MSIVQNPLIGRTKKQSGGMVFTTLNGQNVMKAKPASYRDANTLVQQGNRAYHKAIVQLAASLAPIARSLFEKQPTTMSAYSRILQQLHAMRTGASGEYRFSPDGAVIGSGSVELPISSASYTPSTGRVELSIDNGAALAAGFTNEAISTVILDKSTLQVISFSPEAGDISSDTVVCTIATGLITSQLCIFIYATSGSGADLVKTIKKITQVYAS